jgi:hypothetical protein
LALRWHDLDLNLSALPKNRIDARANRTARRSCVGTRLIWIARRQFGRVDCEIVRNPSTSIDDFGFYLKRDVDQVFG